MDDAALVAAPASVEQGLVIVTREAMRAMSGAAMIADSPDEVRVRVREQLLQRQSVLLVTAGCPRGAAIQTAGESPRDRW
jgi:hypothetical protein